MTDVPATDELAVEEPERPSIRIVTLGRFERLAGASDLLDRLFGDR